MKYKLLKSYKGIPEGIILWYDKMYPRYEYIHNDEKHYEHFHPNELSLLVEAGYVEEVYEEKDFIKPEDFEQPQEKYCIQLDSPLTPNGVARLNWLIENAGKLKIMVENYGKPNQE